MADWLLAYLALTLTESGSIYIRVSVVITYNLKETGGLASGVGGGRGGKKSDGKKHVEEGGGGRDEGWAGRVGEEGRWLMVKVGGKEGSCVVAF